MQLVQQDVDVADTHCGHELPGLEEKTHKVDLSTLTLAAHDGSPEGNEKWLKVLNNTLQKFQCGVYVHDKEAYERNPEVSGAIWGEIVNSLKDSHLSHLPDEDGEKHDAYALVERIKQEFMCINMNGPMILEDILKS